MKFRYLTLGIALLAGLPAYAHEPKASHGGRLADAGPYHVELVAKDTAIEVFLIGENDKPVDPKGFKGVAIFKLGGKAERITLAPSEKSSLSGTAVTALPANPKGAVQLTAPDGKTATARRLAQRPTQPCSPRLHLAPILVLCLLLGLFPQPVLDTSERDLKVVADIQERARERSQQKSLAGKEYLPLAKQQVGTSDGE
jgi:hypothetical protein